MRHLWTIVCFALHQSRSTNSPQTGLHHQQQALLSNAPSSASVLWSVVKMAWVWRSKRVAAVRHSTALVLATLLHISLFGAVGVFSSRVVSAGDEVLVRSDVCGWVGNSLNLAAELNGTQLIDTSIAEYTFGKWAGVQSLNYARKCYNATHDVGACRSYAVPYIDSVSATNAPCPFSDKICALKEGVQVDTGFLDSSRALGINSPESSRIRFRKTLTCVPTLAEEKYSTPWTEMDEPGEAKLPGNGYKSYLLGPTSDSPDATWVISNYSFWDDAALPYTLG